MENQDIDLLGQTVGNMPYKIGIVDENGNLKNQFVANASTNRIDIPEQRLNGGGSTGGSTGGNTGGGNSGNTGGGNSSSQVAQLPSTVNLFTGSVVGNILLSGPSTNYDNVQDGLLITLGNQTSEITTTNNSQSRVDLTPSGLKTIKIPKEKLIVNSSFDISDQLSQYIGKTVQGQFYDSSSQTWSNYGSTYNFRIVSFGGTIIKVLPNATLNINLTMNATDSSTPGDGNHYNGFQIPVIRVNTYKN